MRSNNYIFAHGLGAFMMKTAFISTFFVFCVSMSFGQGIEDEIEYKYVTAEYLFRTERYEEAIKAFTAIINEDPNFSDAMLMRAKAKYMMAAYKGTKKDLLKYISAKGINKDVLVYLGKVEYKIGNDKAALQSLETAAGIGVDDAQVYEFLGNLLLDDGKQMQACKYWRKAAKMGSSKAAVKVKKHCGRVDEGEGETGGIKPSKSKSKLEGLPVEKKNDTKREDKKIDPADFKKDHPTKEQRHRDEDDSLRNPTKEKVLKTQKEEENDKETTDGEQEGPSARDENLPEDDDFGPVPPDDNTPNTIKVDQYLTLSISGQGLGKRRVLDKPNILILSDKDGKVAVDICVNKNGKVTSAEFNGKLSTIARKSLVSLAIRKAKEFWFEKSDYKEQCGVLIFDIKS